MVSWTCPYCGKSMHSAWDKRTDRLVVCIHCDGTFKNRTSERRDEDAQTQEAENADAGNN